MVEEKLSSVGKSSGDVRELYLGLLYSTEEHKIFGYVTNTKIKFVIVVESSNTVLRDNEVRMMFRRLHTLYTDVVCNPFYIPGDPILSNCVAVLAMLVVMSMSYPNHRRRSMQVIPLLGDQQSEESGYAPQVLLPAQDLQAAATGHEHLGRVQIKVYRGPTNHHGHEHFAPHGFWVKQPADDSHHH
uniref:Trafficking protein particle complex subunit 2-like protein n=1 Tax=Timema genevievae TaxID=629358 RepID=A0A7R9PRR7_TIMGE|nr:unnamed protein product [Timema genevievae]